MNCLFARPAAAVALVFKKGSHTTWIIYIPSDLELLNQPAELSKDQDYIRDNWAAVEELTAVTLYQYVLSSSSSSSWLLLESHQRGSDKICWFLSSGMSSLVLSGLLTDF